VKAGDLSSCRVLLSRRSSVLCPPPTSCEANPGLRLFALYPVPLRLPDVRCLTGSPSLLHRQSRHAAARTPTAGTLAPLPVPALLRSSLLHQKLATPILRLSHQQPSKMHDGASLAFTVSYGLPVCSRARDGYWPRCVGHAACPPLTPRSSAPNYL